MKDRRFRNVLAIGIILLSILLFIEVYNMDYDMPAVAKFIAIVIVLGTSGYALQMLYRLDGGYGLLLIKTKKGLDLIERLADRYKTLWTAMADIGFVWGFGLLGSFLLYRKIDEKRYVIFASAIGMCLLIFSATFIAPVIVSLTLSVISNIEIGKTSQSVAGLTSNGFYIYLVTALLVLGGYTLLLIFGLILYSVIVVGNLINIILIGEPPVEPSGTLLLPGINLPFWEGIIALVLLLIVHESSHGFLSRIAKVKLKSAGIALFGFIPVGAFVDPDEDNLKKRKKLEQTRVMAAGSAANLFVTFSTFLILLAFMHITEDFRDQGVIVVGGSTDIPIGAKIISINGVDVYAHISEHGNLTGIVEPEQEVMVVTDKGTFNLTSNENGMLGVRLTVATRTGYIFHFVKGYEWLGFIYRTLALILVLNFMVGIINFLPIPAFDGYRILEINLPWRMAVRVLSYAILICFVLNFLPWLFK